jgi:hypothetical protein
VAEVTFATMADVLYRPLPHYSLKPHRCRFCGTHVRPIINDDCMECSGTLLGYECSNDGCGAEWNEDGEATQWPFEEFSERWCARRGHKQTRPVPEFYWSTECVCGKRRDRTREQWDADPKTTEMDRLVARVLEPVIDFHLPLCTVLRPRLQELAMER